VSFNYYTYWFEIILGKKLQAIKKIYIQEFYPGTRRLKGGRIHTAILLSWSVHMSAKKIPMRSVVERAVRPIGVIVSAPEFDQGARFRFF